jgi:transmembrane sensor
MTNPKPMIFSKPESSQHNQIAEEAMAWFSRLQTGDVSNLENSRFQNWLSQSPTHRQAYEEVLSFWHDTDFNQALKISSLNGNFNTNQPRFNHNRKQTKYLAFVLAASIACMAVLFDPITRLQADYYTPVGSKQTVHLSDGSTVTLNTDTAIAVAFRKNERRIKLLKGEAYFTVQHLGDQPFIVEGGETEARVVGTWFMVRNIQNEEKVAVVKGLVNVSNHGKTQTVDLHPGEQVANYPAGLSAIQPFDNNRETTWLQDRLSFQDAPLEEVVKELSRYIPGLVIISDNALKTIRINGRFNITQPKQALATLAHTLPVAVTTVGDWLTVIRPR